MKNNDRIKYQLIKMIRDVNARAAVDSVGGYDQFKRVMGIESFEDYLILFNDLEIEYSNDLNDKILFKYGNNIKMVFAHNLLIVLSDDFFQLISYSFECQKNILRSWASDVFNINAKHIMCMKKLHA